MVWVTGKFCYKCIKHAGNAKKCNSAAEQDSRS